MGNVVPPLIIVAGMGAVMGGFAWLARLVRRRGLAGNAMRAAMAAYEQGWHVSGYEAYEELRVQADRTVPIPVPDDPLRPSRGVARRGRQRVQPRGCQSCDRALPHPHHSPFRADT
jgi:hypothetical protein